MPQNHEITKSHKKDFSPIPEELEEIGGKIVHAAYLVHRALGPGLLEKVYEICFCHELTKMGLEVKRQVDIPIMYDEKIFDEGLRLDVLVENACDVLKKGFNNNFHCLKTLTKRWPFWTKRLPKSVENYFYNIIFRMRLVKYYCKFSTS